MPATLTRAWFRYPIRVGSWQAIQIIRADGHRAADIRPLVRLNVSVVVSQDGRMESGSSGAGGPRDV